MCLVLGEGIAQKAPKIQRYTSQLEEVDWPWLQDLIDGNYGSDDADEETDDDEEKTSQSEEADEPTSPAGPPRPKRSEKFLRDLIAGRPVFGHPSEAGGFRLRYGRARNHGFATAGVHPATMHLVDDFLATGTQIKTERPGKAAGVVPVDTIEGPTVRLANGDVRRIDDPAEALEVRNGVERIIDLGEYLVNYGEFVENNHPLSPASYTVEWWEGDMEAAGADVQAWRDSPRIDLMDPDTEQLLEWADEYDAPLHPTHTYLWHDIGVERFESLAESVAASGNWAEADGAAGLERDESDAGERTLVLPADDELCETLETLLVEHSRGEETVTVPDALPFVRSLGLTDTLERNWEELPDSVRTFDGGDNAVEAVNAVAPFEVRERAPTRVGCRMGRPEKSEKRDLSPAVHTLFPIGETGGSQRDIAAAAKHSDSMRDTPGEVDVDVARRSCPDCGTDTFRPRCPDCEAVTEPHYVCWECEIDVELDESGRAICPNCEREAEAVETRTIDVNEEYRTALSNVGERENAFEILKGVKGLTSEHKLPEPVEKGVLRAKNGVSTFKDGTVRYDMTDLPVTSVRAAELDVAVDQLRGLGYEEDIHGEPLTHEDQLVELRVQDVVLSDGAAEHMMRTAEFVDDLLEQYYEMEPFYELEEREDLVGELVFGMAPHTSAAVVGRIIGFTSAAVGYAHPYFHAAKRRNCFHPETKIRYEDGDGSHHETIESFVEARLEDPREDDFGTLIEELDSDVYVPSLTENGERVQRPVEAVSKHVAPDLLLRIETRDGRKIDVTSDHRMLRVADGIERVPASELREGDRLPVGTTEPSPTSTEAIDETGITADGGVDVDIVESVTYDGSTIESTYCLTVSETNSVLANGVYTGQCDGDEDCVMLLMDGLINFSKSFLPNQRGGKMDAPLVMSSRIDPAEIDDEAHNMDIVDSYPREFYEATRRMADPGEVEELIRIGEDTLGTDEQYRGFAHTHDTSNIALGPDLSAYKTLGSMMDKMNAQLHLSRKLRSVDETDVAERVIEYHFLPDLIGNLRAFSRQETRCLDCGEKFRRMPLSGDCRECGGRVNLTVHEGSVNKYMDTALQVAEEFDCREYTKQRLQILDRSLESIFEDDTNKQSGIEDFM